MSGPEAIVGIVFMAGAFTLLRPVGVAVAKRIAGEHKKPALDDAARDELLGEMQAVRQEVAELAERMDFAERMLAKPKNG